MDRKGEHPVNHLAGYAGTVHADGYAGFNGLFGEGKAGEQAYIVHVRRKFLDEAERTGAPIAQQAIKQIAQLYVVEKEARGKSPEQRAALRLAKARPVFDDLEVWLRTQLRKISGKTKLWPKPSAMPWLACPRRGDTSATGDWNLTTTHASVRSAL